MIKAIKAATGPLARAMKLSIGRALLHAVQEGGNRQLLQIEALKGEVRDGVERVQQYGFTSHPLAGAQAVFVCVGGNRDHPVVVALDDPRYRIKDLQAGEVAIFNHQGTKVVLKLDGKIEITGATEVLVDTPLLKCTGEIQDRCNSGGLTMHNMRTIYNGHHHAGGPAPTEQME